MRGPLEDLPSGGYRKTDGILICPICYARERASGAPEADPADAGECDECRRTSEDIEDLLSEDQLQRLAAGIMTVDEMFAILFELGDIL